MEAKSCFFIGSRHTSESINEQLKQAVEKHITQYGVITFTVCYYGNFDSLVIRALKEAKKCHENIKLYLLTPYALDRKEEAPNGFNGTFYPDGLEFVPKRFAIVKANNYMIQHSDYLIAHVQGVGKSRDFVEYAKRREKKGLIKVTLI